MAQPSSNGDLNNNQQGQVQQQQQQWAAAQPHQYQQQWMAMQYPATAMAMMQQQMMMYPQHYMPYAHPHYPPPPPPPPPQSSHHHHHKQAAAAAAAAASSDEIRTVWLGDLHHWMDENYLHNCFAHTGEVVSAKVIRNKQTGQSEGYGFVEFYSRATAEKVLQNYNGTMMPNTDQAFRLNWATFSAGERRSSDATSDLSIFVGDLAIDVTDAMLQETFAGRYSSIKGAKVVLQRIPLRRRRTVSALMTDKPIRVDVPPDVFNIKDFPAEYALQYEASKRVNGMPTNWTLSGNANVTSLINDANVENVVVFIHGYNTTREEACCFFKTMIPQIAANFDQPMKASTRYLCLTWDSRCNRNHWPHVPTKYLWRLATVPLALVAYLDDIDNVTYASRGISFLLNDIARSGKNLHLIGHSMGCQAVITYLSQMASCHFVRSTQYFGGDEKQSQVSKKILENIKTAFLLAPDVPMHRIRQFFKSYYPIYCEFGGLERFVFISNDWDLPIWTSEALRLGTSRAGIPKNIDRCLNAPEFLRLIATRDQTPGADLPSYFERKRRQVQDKYHPLELYDVNEPRLFGHGLFANRTAREIIGCTIQETTGRDVLWGGIRYVSGGMAKRLSMTEFVDAIPGREGRTLLYWKKKRSMICGWLCNPIWLRL